jgi:hypothetical protein
VKPHHSGRGKTARQERSLCKNFCTNEPSGSIPALATSPATFLNPHVNVLGERDRVTFIAHWEFISVAELQQNYISRSPYARVKLKPLTTHVKRVELLKPISDADPAPRT